LKAVEAALVAVAFAAAGMSAQTGASQVPSTASAEEALRGRVKHFYSLQMENKFRAAESCVCEDTKDYYYDLQKKAPRSFEISQIELAKDNTEAKVVTLLSGELATISGAIPVTLPIPTQWKLENGQWCYFVPVERQKAIVTPFGVIKNEPAPANSGSRPSPPLPFNPVKVEDLQNAVEATAEAVVFDAAKAAAAEIEFLNSLAGKVKIDPPTSLPPGLKIILDRTALGPKEKAKVRFEYAPTPNVPAESYDLPFNIEPTRQVIRIRVRFERPVEVKKTPPFQFPPPPATQKQE
jgi:hypothetical protein